MNLINRLMCKILNGFMVWKSIRLLCPSSWLLLIIDLIYGFANPKHQTLNSFSSLVHQSIDTILLVNYYTVLSHSNGWVTSNFDYYHPSFISCPRNLLFLGLLCLESSYLLVFIYLTSILLIYLSFSFAKNLTFSLLELHYLASNH